MRRRLEAKKDFITGQECDEKVPFIDFIEQRLKSDPVARKIAAFVQRRKRAAYFVYGHGRDGHA